MTLGSQSGNAAGAAGDFAAAHERLLGDRSIQCELPPATMVPTGQPQYAPPPTGPGVAPSLPDPAAAGASPAVQILIWGTVAILVMFMLYWVARSVRDRRRAPGGQEEPEAGLQPEAAPALALLGEADALARTAIWRSRPPDPPPQHRGH